MGLKLDVGLKLRVDLTLVLSSAGLMTDEEMAARVPVDADRLIDNVEDDKDIDVA